MECVTTYKKIKSTTTHLKYSLCCHYLFLPQFGNLRLHRSDFPILLGDVLKQFFLELAVAGVLGGQGGRNGLHLRGVCWLLYTEDGEKDTAELELCWWGPVCKWLLHTAHVSVRFCLRLNLHSGTQVCQAEQLAQDLFHAC